MLLLPVMFHIYTCSTILTHFTQIANNDLDAFLFLSKVNT